MKIIDVPASILQIPFPLPNGQKIQRDYTFSEFIADALDSNMKLGKSLSNIKKGHDLLELTKEKNPKDVIQLEDAQYELLKESVEGCQYNPAVALRVVPYFEAVHNAQPVPAKDAKLGKKDK